MGYTAEPMKRQNALLTLYCCTFVLLPIAVESRAATPGPTPSWTKLTLKQCEDHTLRHHPLVAAAKFGVDIYKAKLMQARWSRFPQLTLTVGGSVMPSQRGNPLVGQTIWNKWGGIIRTDLTGYMPLYTFGKISNLTKAAISGVKANQALVELNRNELLYIVRKAYWGWQVADEIDQKLSKALERLRKEKKKLAAKLKKNPDADQNDMLNLKIAETELVARRLTTQKQLRLSQLGLRLVMTLRSSETIDLKSKEIELVKVALKSDTHYVNLGLRHRPDIRAMGYKVRANRSLLSHQKAFYFPDLFLGGFLNFSYTAVTDDQSSPFAYDPYRTLSGGVFLGLRLTLDFPTKVARVREQRAKLNQLRAQQRVFVDRAKFEISTASIDAQNECKMVELLERAKRATRAILTEKGNSYDEGFGSLGDLLKAIHRFYEKDLKHIEAIYKCNLAVANLSKVVGVDIVRTK